MAVRPETIPPGLTRLDRWGLWAYEWFGTRWSKVPRRVSQRRRLASVSHLDDWTAFHNALRVYELDRRTGGDITGVGFLLANDGISIIDIDKCLDPAMSLSLDALSPDARALVERLDSFTELSPSGTGLHVIVRARLPGPGRRRNGIELYDRGRFFALTGVRLPETRPEIAERQSAVEALYQELAPAVSAPRTGGEAALTLGATGLPDDEIIRLASRGGSLGDRFELLFVFGEWQPFFRSQSEADLWLIGRIAYFAGPDATTIARVFLQSRLAQRQKITDRQDYLDRTIQKAISGRTRFFDAHRKPER
jgi:primase-polymerase (primpol)-like protein